MYQICFFILPCINFAEPQKFGFCILQLAYHDFCSCITEIYECMFKQYLQQYKLTSVKPSMDLTLSCRSLALVHSNDSTSLRFNDQDTKVKDAVLLLADNWEKLLNWQWFKDALQCEKKKKKKKQSAKLNLLYLFEFSQYNYRILDVKTSISFNLL